MIRVRTTSFILLFMGLLPTHVDAQAAEKEAALESAPAPEAAARLQASVVALDTRTGASIREGQVIEGGAKGTSFTDQQNRSYELAPYAVGEFASGDFRLLRGSAVIESSKEGVARTGSARVDFVGKLALSYDFKAHSTSAFVLDGQARMVNPAANTDSLRLDRFHGATLEVGEVMPQMIRQLDVAGVQEWLSGYAWSEEKIEALTKALPKAFADEKPRIPEHVKEAKLEDYFSSIEAADDDQPEYYEKKFKNPEALEANAKDKKAAAKGMTPEEAALIALPNTHINLGFDLPPQILSADQKAKETWANALRAPAAVKKGKRLAAKPASRGLASVSSHEGDPAIEARIERLRSLSVPEPVRSEAPNFGQGRAPASVGSGAVPDPVYDYSQNF